MPLSPSEIVQLTVIVFLASALFFTAYSLPQIISSTALMLFIPIQPVETRFGTANVLLTFVIFLAMVLRKEKVRLPLLPNFLVILFIYLLSMSFVHSALYAQHVVYILSLVSAFLVFWIAYDLTYRYRNLRGIVAVFLAVNLVVIIYCVIQLGAGPGQKVTLFGISEMTMIPARWDNRLVGPFGATGITSEFFVIMIFLILHQLFFSRDRWLRRTLIAFVALDLSFLIATANRGGFLSLLGGCILFLWLFRNELGSKRVVQTAIGGIIMLSLVSAIVIQYTEFDRLYSRLGETTFEEGIPDTRQQTWPVAVAKIMERPLIGHGPRFQMQDAMHGKQYPGYEYQPYPHNLYMFLLSTVGVLGLLAFLVFLFTPLLRCWRAMSISTVDPEVSAFLKTGVIIMIVILVDQMKIEFMRITLVDYWHFLFALFGVLIAVSDQVKERLAVVDSNYPVNQPV